MGWGTSYIYDGYLNRVLPNEIDEKIEEYEESIQSRWQDILAYMAATPPAYTEDEEGGKIDYPEFLSSLLTRYREEMAEDYFWLNILKQAKETLEEHPENVTSD